MNADELRQDFDQAKKIILDERRMRAKVFPPGHPEREAKLKEMDDLLAIFVRWKEAVKVELGLGYEQPPLLDVPAKTEYR